MVAELLPLQRFTCCAPPSLSGLEALAALNHYQEYTFTWEPGTCINAMDVVFDEHTEVLVLPYLGFQAGFTMASHSVPLGILEFVRVAMKAGAQPTPKAESCRPPSVNTELLEQYPWLSAYMSKPGSFSKASGSKATVGEVESHSLGLDDDATEAAYVEVQEQRRLWDVKFKGDIQHFKVCLLGGAWTKEHMGVVCDAVKAYASGQDAQAWCSKYALPLSARFGLRRCGQDQATALAGAWCARMQYFYDIFMQSSARSYQYTAEDIKGYAFKGEGRNQGRKPDNQSTGKFEGRARKSGGCSAGNRSCS